MAVDCGAGFVSLYKIGEPTALKIENDKAQNVDVGGDGPVVIGRPVKTPPALKLENLCQNGQPSPALRKIFTEQLGL